ncbi:hypothetical protein HanIR_Chr16g0830171 [Helianthus annuus]|nr:hypothetical protein HanIR_Chr16g0830171 [Helianthus annuus]
MGQTGSHDLDQGFHGLNQVDFCGQQMRFYGLQVKEWAPFSPLLGEASGRNRQLDMKTPFLPI